MVYDAIEQGNFTKGFEWRDQIRGAECFDAGFDNKFVVFLKYVRRSASEMQSEIYLAPDRNYVDESTFKQIYDKATETKKIINALIAYLRKSKPGKVS